MTSLERARELFMEWCLGERENAWACKDAYESAIAERDKKLVVAMDALHDICERNEEEKPAHEIASDALDRIDTLRKEGTMIDKEQLEKVKKDYNGFAGLLTQLPHDRDVMTGIVRTDMRGRKGWTLYASYKSSPTDSERRLETSIFIPDLDI